jgi:hypothetical protein
MAPRPQAGRHRLKAVMHNPNIHKLLVESRTRDLNNDAAARRARQLLTASRLRRWHRRFTEASPAPRFAI